MDTFVSSYLWELPVFSLPLDGSNRFLPHGVIYISLVNTLQSLPSLNISHFSLSINQCNILPSWCIDSRKKATSLDLWHCFRKVAALLFHHMNGALSLSMRTLNCFHSLCVIHISWVVSKQANMAAPFQQTMRGSRSCVMKEKWHGINKISRNACGHSTFGSLSFIFIHIPVTKPNQSLWCAITKMVP